MAQLHHCLAWVLKTWPWRERWWTGQATLGNPPSCLCRHCTDLTPRTNPNTNTKKCADKKYRNPSQILNSQFCWCLKGIEAAARQLPELRKPKALIKAVVIKKLHIYKCRCRAIFVWVCVLVSSQCWWKRDWKIEGVVWVQQPATSDLGGKWVNWQAAPLIRAFKQGPYV